jgi:hypothetical protein
MLLGVILALFGGVCLVLLVPALGGIRRYK